MKKKIGLLVLGIGLIGSLTGCDQYTTRTLGGSMELKLEPGQKLELITWKDDDSLWYLTRPMREGEEPETHIYKEQSEYGYLEGTVTIIESKKE